MNNKSPKHPKPKSYKDRIMESYKSKKLNLDILSSTNRNIVEQIIWEKDSRS